MAKTRAIFLTTWWASTVMLAGTSHAWTTSTKITSARGSASARSLQHARSPTASATSTTALFGKKKTKKSGGGNATASAKMQVKLLRHIPGTGRAGDVVMVNPVFFSNKLRPQKLARAITDEEVQKDLEAEREKSDALRAEAKALRELLDGDSDNDNDNDSDSSSPFVLKFLDNQTGPDGRKLFGGIGPKKLMEALRTNCKEFDSYSKTYTKQVSILDVEEQMRVETEIHAEKSAYEDYSYPSSSSSSGGGETSEKRVTVSYSSLPKSDKMTIKNTGAYRIKVSLTKDLFARVMVLVE